MLIISQGMDGIYHRQFLPLDRPEGWPYGPHEPSPDIAYTSSIDSTPARNRISATSSPSISSESPSAISSSLTGPSFQCCRGWEKIFHDGCKVSLYFRFGFSLHFCSKYNTTIMEPPFDKFWVFHLFWLSFWPFCLWNIQDCFQNM